MPFVQFKLDRSVNQTRGIFDKYIYKTGDTIEEVISDGYFENARFITDWNGGIIECECSNGYFIGHIEPDHVTIEMQGEFIKETAEDYTTKDYDDVIVCTGPLTISLIKASGATKSVTIRSVANTVLVVAFAGDLIEAQASVNITDGQALTLAPIASGWVII